LGDGCVHPSPNCGVVMNEPRSAPYSFEVTNRPVCATKEAPRHYFKAQPPRLEKAGNGFPATILRIGLTTTTGSHDYAFTCDRMDVNSLM
jgi:hypothetical protein